MKKISTKWIIVLCIGILVIIGSIGYSLLSIEQWNQKMSNAEDEYYAASDDILCYVPAQYVSDSFASYDTYDQMQFYFVFDQTGTPYIVCMHDDTFEQYSALNEYLYSDETDAPPVQNMYGETVVIDSELMEYAEDAYNDMYGEELVNNDNFGDFFGYYYVDMETSYSIESIIQNAIIALIVGLAVFLIGLIGFIKSKKAEKNLTSNYGAYTDTNSLYQNSETYMQNAGYNQSNVGNNWQTATVTDGTTNMSDTGVPVYPFTESQMGATNTSSNQRLYQESDEDINRMKGFFGALVGALIGAIAWVIVGHLGFISGWIAVLMVYLAMQGYKKLSGGIDKFGKVISSIIVLLLIFPADYIMYMWDYLESYYTMHVRLSDVFANVTQLLLYDSSTQGYFLEDLLSGYAIAIICIIIFLKKSKSDGKLEYVILPRVASRIAKSFLMLLLLFALMGIGAGIAYINVTVGIFAIMISICVFIYMYYRFNSLAIYIMSSGFKYNDGKHKSNKIIKWDSIYSVTGPNADNICCIIRTKDHQEYLLDGSKFDKFDILWAKLKVYSTPAA